MSNDSGVIGFVLYPEKGGYLPTFKLARTLKKYGYQIIYFGTIEFREEVNNQGFEFQVVLEDGFGDGVFDPAPLPEGTGFIAQHKHNIVNARMIQTVLYHALVSGELNAIFKKKNVDLLLIDALLGPVAVTAHNSKIKVITIATELVGLNSSVAPYESSLICRSHSSWISIRIAIKWLQLKCRQKLMMNFFSLFELLITSFKQTKDLKLLMKQYRKIEKKSGLKFTMSEYGYRPMFTEFVLCPQAFEYDRAISNSSRKYIGHCIDFSRKEPAFPWEKIIGDRPIIYCSLGTHVAIYRQADFFFRILLESARKLNGYTFIVSMGPGRVLDSYGPVPSNVFSQDRIPQIAVLRKAAMMITNGGLGTVKECIYLSVPMLVLPCGFDQPGNAARICHHGLGRRANIEKINSRQLQADIQELIENPFYKRNLNKMSQQVQSDTDFENGIQLIQETLDTIRNLKTDSASFKEAKMKA